MQETDQWGCFGGNCEQQAICCNDQSWRREYPRHLLLLSRLRAQMATLSIRNQARKDGMSGPTTLKEVNALIKKSRVEQNRPDFVALTSGAKIGLVQNNKTISGQLPMRPFSFYRD